MFGNRDDRAKVHERASRLALAGDLPRAIATLADRLEAHPDDDRTLIKLAELHRTAGDAGAAVAAYSRAAGLYLASGFTLKAAASLRQAAGLVPDDPEVAERLAEVNATLGLSHDAARGFEQAAAAAGAGDPDRALALRRRVVALLPADPGAQLRLADALVAAGERAEAVALLERAAEPLQAPAQAELWIHLQERLCDLEPGDAARAKAVARALLDRGSPKRALARLRPCLADDPSDREARSLLARALGALGEDAALAEELAEADFLAENGGVEEARAILLRLRDRHPGSEAIAGRLDVLDAEPLAAEEILDGEEPRESTTAILERAPAERAPSAAEAAMHRDLAVAFLEMERFGDALAELQKAIAADPPREAACLAIAGRCHLARGAPRDAVDAYRRALAAAALPVEAATALQYELGEALTAAGDAAEALGAYREAARLDPAFRDVAARVRALASAA